MRLIINKNYVEFITIALFTLIDSFFACIIGESQILFIFHSLFNIILLSLISLKKNGDDCIIFAILFMLFYTYFIDVYIHYFKIRLIFETEYLYCIPIFISVFRIRNFNSKKFAFLSILYLLFNFIILILNHKVSSWNYIIFLPYILTFISFYIIFNNIDVSEKFKDLYRFIFILCFWMTLFQTAVGFNQDTRNGIFSVFGWGAYTFFIMYYPIYIFAKYLKKEKKLLHLFFSVLLCCILFICTESKAAIVFMFFSMMIMAMVSKGISIKKILFFLVAIVMIPLSFSLLIKFNPKFYYLNDFNRIIRYYTGNNDWRYKYGRFEALGVVYRNLDSTTDKIFGVGFGSSVPLNHNLYEELNRNIPKQYYIKKYGYRHGFQNTSTAVAILDGGLLLYVIIVFFLFNKVSSAIVRAANMNSLVSQIKLGMCVYLLYIFIYSCVFKDFRYMAIIGIILGMNNFSFDNVTNKMLRIMR